MGWESHGPLSNLDRRIALIHSLDQKNNFGWLAGERADLA